MCRICGELRFDATAPDSAAIARMSETLARRGPDHAGTYADGPVAFGHRHLAIIDSSASADQPMVDTALRLALVDEVLRFDATTLIVDDPFKRLDNMPKAWGLEVRVPFLDHALVELAARMPPELKLKEGGKFPLRAISRGVIPDAVIDHPKGCFPVPALKHVRNPFLGLVQGLLQSDACIRRELYQRACVDKLLAKPEAHFTRIQGSKLWHLALLEWWLQVHVDGVTAGAITQPGSKAVASTSRA